MADNFNMKKFLAENKLGAYSKLKENKTAEELFQMFKDEDLLDDRREYDEEDLMSAYPDLSKEEAEKLVSKLQNLEEKTKLAKEDYAGAEEEKMMDFLAEYEVIYVVENGRCYRITDEGYKDEVNMSYCRRYAGTGVREEKEEAFSDVNENSYLMATNPDVKAKVDKIVELLIDIDVDGETMEYILGAVGMDDQMANQLVHNKAELNKEAFGGKNPEGDKLVLRFLQGVAKKFDYPVAKAAMFVKDTIKSLGY